MIKSVFTWKEWLFSLAIVSLLIAALFFLASCHRNEFFLDYKLGMKESEYESLSNRYIKEGVLERGYSTIAGYSIEDNFYKFPFGQKAVMFAYFSKDSLKELTMNVRGDKLNPLDGDGYKSISDFFKSIYGRPSEIGKDSLTGIEYVYWNDFRGSRIELAYSTPEDDWLGSVSIVCVEKKINKGGAISHVNYKKQFSFVDDLKTCKEAENLALQDYNENRYRFVMYGMPSENAINFVDLAKKKYGINIQLGGCISSEFGNCYSDKMIFLLSSKFGEYFMRDLYADARASDVPLEPQKQ